MVAAVAAAVSLTVRIVSPPVVSPSAPLVSSVAIGAAPRRRRAASSLRRQRRRRQGRRRRELLPFSRSFSSPVAVVASMMMVRTFAPVPVPAPASVPAPVVAAVAAAVAAALPSRRTRARARATSSSSVSSLSSSSVAAHFFFPFCFPFCERGHNFFRFSFSVFRQNYKCPAPKAVKSREKNKRRPCW